MHGPLASSYSYFLYYVSYCTFYIVSLSFGACVHVYGVHVWKYFVIVCDPKASVYENTMRLWGVYSSLILCHDCPTDQPTYVHTQSMHSDPCVVILMNN